MIVRMVRGKVVESQGPTFQIGYASAASMSTIKISVPELLNASLVPVSPVQCNWCAAISNNS